MGGSPREGAVCQCLRENDDISRLLMDWCHTNFVLLDRSEMVGTPIIALMAARNATETSVSWKHVS